MDGSRDVHATSGRIEGPFDVSFRPLVEADLPDIMRWLADAEVVRFYGESPTDVAAAKADYVDPTPDSPTWRYVIEWRGQGVGEVQYYHRYAGKEYEWDAGIDIFIGDPGARGHGVGIEAVRVMLRYLFEVKRVHRAIIDPEVRNERAVHVYRRAGMRLDGVVRHNAFDHGERVRRHAVPHTPRGRMARGESPVDRRARPDRLTRSPSAAPEAPRPSITSSTVDRPLLRLQWDDLDMTDEVQLDVLRFSVSEELTMLARIGVAAVGGALIGFERRRSGKSAGMRTLMLVSMGAALFTLVSIFGFAGHDQSRVAAQVVTGVGFLGAGTILHRGGLVHGLTTAASIWMAAAVGVAAGTGLYVVAVGTATLAVAVMGLWPHDIPEADSGRSADTDLDSDADDEERAAETN